MPCFSWTKFWKVSHFFFFVKTLFCFSVKLAFSFFFRNGLRQCRSPSCCHQSCHFECFDEIFAKRPASGSTPSPTATGSTGSTPTCHHTHRLVSFHGKLRFLHDFILFFVFQSPNYLRLQADLGTGVFEYVVKFVPPIDMRVERFRLLKQYENVIMTKVRKLDVYAIWKCMIFRQSKFLRAKL